MSPNGKLGVNRFWKRRLRQITILLGFVLLLGVWCRIQEQNLVRTSFQTGYLLFAAIVFLTLFSARKRLTFLPSIGTASFWMQLHIYVGLATFAIFGFHVGWRFPSGLFEQTLASLYLIVAGSGVYGLYLTRAMPARLTALKNEVLYERIPALRLALATRTRELVMESQGSSDVLARFYVNNLSQFFDQPRGFIYLIHPSGNRRRRLVAAIGDLDRYLEPEQRRTSRELQSLVCEKDDLDYHHAVQGRLKLWLFVHIGFTYGLLLFSILHGLMAHSFGGGLV